MKRIFYWALAFAISFPMYACSSDDPSDTEPETPPATPDDGNDNGNDDNDDDTFVLPPFVYDDDMGYDITAFLAEYTGKPYKGPHKVPGIIEAEDFDDGDNGVAFYESDTKTADASYHGAHDVDIRFDGNASNGYYIGEVQPGEWMSYTIDVEQDGMYSIDTYCVKGDDSEGNLYFEVDGRGACLAVQMPLGSWTDFSRKTTATDIRLTKGRHILKYYGATPGNVDKFELKRTGELKDYASSFSYPMTKTMKNPLFADFPSPMYNSWMTGKLYTADASARVWNINGREVLYVYASHDMGPAAGCDRMDRYHVFSTEDMKTWTDHGEILNAATVRLQNGWGSEGFMWAPDCVYNPDNKLYYFYFPHPLTTESWNSTWKTGVAVSPYPDREFRVIGYIVGAASQIDPCVFIDDDGQPYIYNGGGGKCFGGKLNRKDWTKLDGTMKQMTGLEDFHEATWVHKYNGKYYLSYADNNNGHNRLRYAISDSPLGPWTYKGIYLDETTCDTSHGSIVQFKGKWNAFYHCSDVSGQGNLRSVCVDELLYNADGTIQKVKQTR